MNASPLPQFRILHNPTPSCAWLIPDQVLFGSHPTHSSLRALIDIGLTTIVSLESSSEMKMHKLYDYHALAAAHNIDIISLPIPDGSIAADEAVFELVHRLAVLAKDGHVIYIHCRTGHGRSLLIAALVASEMKRIDPPIALKYAMTCHATRDPNTKVILSSKQQAQILRFRRPLRVIFCGDRDSSYIFEEELTFELKNLPPHSVVIHGGCRGIDLYAAELAQLLNIETVEYPAMWDEFGQAAGPMRNMQMLTEEDPDLVLAFHPDIRLSRGTRNMIMTAWKAGVSVFIHDRIRKLEFRGDVDNM